MKILLSLVMLMIYASLFSVLLYLSTNKTKTINNNNNINKLLRIYKSEKAFNEINYNFTNRTLNKSSIFCMILTSKKNLESRVSITYEAWAHKCDDHDFVLLIPGEEKKIGQRIEKKINNTFKLLQPESLLNDSYEKLTDKVYHMFIDAYKYKKKYDWYVKADDDTFLFVDNLRQFLHNKNSSEAVSYGYDFKVKAKNGYQSGGAGYVLSNQAFERLGSALINNYTFCPNSGTEDIDCISCLDSLGVKKGKSTDSLGREKFFPQNILDFFYGTNKICFLNSRDSIVALSRLFRFTRFRQFK